jgi:SAM-dependent methyltransferase
MIEERNDALKNRMFYPIERYNFACKKFKDMNIADAGCGMGYGVKLLTDLKNRVLGIDISGEAVEYAISEYKVLAIRSDIQEFDYFGFEGVVCLEALCHLKEPERFLDRIKDKVIVISAPIDPNPNDGYIYRITNLNEEKFKELLSNWHIIDELRQNDNGQIYLTVYGVPKNIS